MGKPFKLAGLWGSKGLVPPQKTTLAINPIQLLNCSTVTWQQLSLASFGGSRIIWDKEEWIISLLILINYCTNYIYNRKLFILQILKSFVKCFAWFILTDYMIIFDYTLAIGSFLFKTKKYPNVFILVSDYANNMLF